MNRVGVARGFTIVELLVVIVVIAILAALSIVGFNGISKRATVSGLKAELLSAGKKVEGFKIASSTDEYPSDFSVLGISTSGDVERDYRESGKSYCLAYAKSGNVFHISSYNRTPTEGACGVLGKTTTAAGSGIYGSADGTGTGAQVYPWGISDAPDGSLFIASLSGSVRKMTQEGVVTTIPISGVTNPYIVAIHAADDGYIYASESTYNRVLKIAQDGTATVVAGTYNTRGDTDGNGTAAQFNQPYGLTVDSTGTIFVADTWNHRIRKITPNGDVTTFAGSTQGYAEGNGTAARFNRPYGITHDAQGNLYVSDTNNTRIRKITPSGDVTTLASVRVGGLDIGPTGDIYAAAYSVNSIVKISLSGEVTTVAGSGTAGFADGNATEARLYSPNDVTATPDGSLYVADLNNYRIRKIR